MAISAVTAYNYLGIVIITLLNTKQLYNTSQKLHKTIL